MKIIKKIKNKLIQLELAEIAPNIFAVKVEDKYDRAMLFMRYQEFYESPFKEFRGKKFDIFRYMKVYQMDRRENMFTYTRDWTGYNIPSESLIKCLKGLENNEELVTSYDQIMLSIIKLILSRIGKEKFYLLGVDNYDSWVMKHEMAHGLFYVNKEYKKKMVHLWEDETPVKIKKELTDILKKMGYCDEVIIDEAQAYLGTGICDQMKFVADILAIAKKYEVVVNEYLK